MYVHWNFDGKNFRTEWEAFTSCSATCIVFQISREAKSRSINHTYEGVSPLRAYDLQDVINVDATSFPEKLPCFVVLALEVAREQVDGVDL